MSFVFARRHCHSRILFLFKYAKIEYVSVRAYLSKNRIRTLRILEPCRRFHLVSVNDCKGKWKWTVSGIVTGLLIPALHVMPHSVCDYATYMSYPSLHLWCRPCLDVYPVKLLRRLMVVTSENAMLVSCHIS